VNGTVVAPALDLYDDELRTGEGVLPDVELRAGDNELRFVVAGLNPRAHEWGPGAGLYKMAFDYVVVR
jgi:hypothetical protein